MHRVTLALIVLLLSACRDEGADARARADAALTKAASGLRTAQAEPGEPQAEALRTAVAPLESIRDATREQQAAAALLVSGARLQAGLIELRLARHHASACRVSFDKAAALLRMAATLQAMAVAEDPDSALDPIREAGAAAEALAQAAEAAASEFLAQAEGLDRSQEQLRTDAGASADAARALLQEAQSIGGIAALDTIDDSVDASIASLDTRAAADRMRAEAELLTNAAASLRGQIPNHATVADRASGAQEAYSQGVEAQRQVVAAAHEAATDAYDSGLSALESATAPISGSIEPRLNRARDDFAAAEQAADRAAAGGGRFGTEATLAKASALAASARADSLTAMLLGVEARTVVLASIEGLGERDARDAHERATAAREAAVQALRSAIDAMGAASGSAGAASAVAALEREATLLENETLPEPPAPPTQAGDPRAAPAGAAQSGAIAGRAGLASPEAVAQFINGMDPGREEVWVSFSGLIGASSREGAAVIQMAQIMGDMAPFMASLASAFGADALSGQSGMPIPTITGLSAEVTSVNGETALLSLTSNGETRDVGLFSSGGNWFIDGGSLLGEGAAQLSAAAPMLAKARPAMKAAAAATAARIRAGEFPDAQSAMAAFQGAMQQEIMRSMGQMPPGK